MPPGDPVTGQVTFRVMGNARGDPSGGDSMLAKVPARWYGQLGGQPILLGPVIKNELRKLSTAGAANLGERLHHADWIITRDEAEVTRIGLTHDCETCRAGTAAAVTWLREDPAHQIAAGMLWWA